MPSRQGTGNSKSLTKMLGKGNVAERRLCLGIKALLLFLCTACFRVNKYTLGGMRPNWASI